MTGLVSQCETSKPVGIVVIGRNEGQHLKACLMSACGEGLHVVYVDSGSTDESLVIANMAGVDVVELDSTRPFTAARARNEGMQHLKTVAPECDFVQFVDGDCVIEPGWADAARNFLVENSGVTIVCGRLREQFPERTIYNYLCDIEWNGPVGEIRACGGIFMMRTVTFQELGGFREDLRAGEEPELCLRVRLAGGKVWRVATDMALHDADMHRFTDWWRRCRRGGYAYAEVSSLHINSSMNIWMREKYRALTWGALLPILTVLGSLFVVHFLWLLLAYPLQFLRIALRSRRSFDRPWLYALSAIVGKFAEAFGIIRFYKHMLLCGHVTLKEQSKVQIAKSTSSQLPAVGAGQHIDLAVVIINYRAVKLTLECMDSVLAQLSEHDRLVVIDNNSRDGSLERISNWVKKCDASEFVQVVASPVNGGFAAGNNLGIGACSAQAYLLLNNDTILRPYALATLKAALAAHPDAGAIGSRLENPDGSSQVSRFRDCSPLSELISVAATGPLTRLLHCYNVPIEVEDGTTPADWLSFACILIPSTVIKEIGLLDEGFFMYFEDVEYCRRIRQTGRKLVHEPRARVMHLHGASSGVPGDIQALRRLPAYYYRSRHRYFRLAYGFLGPFAANVCWTIGRLISLVREPFGKTSRIPQLQWLDIWIMR
ncbi:MAG: glycosyltransferase [Anderseniella sp.]|uniref:glycosyltransferase n=1 Tax=Parasphingorhabdus sp. TaxID=2709688 RepID=UPI00327D6207